MTKGRNTSVVSLRLPDEMIQKLKSRARKRGMPLSQMLKQAVSQYANLEETRVINPGESTISKVVSTEAVKSEDMARICRCGAKHTAQIWELIAKARPNEPCPCGARHPDGNSKRYKHCCGKR